MRLYERLGFQREGVVRKKYWSEGRWWDEFAYGVLAEEWEGVR